MDAWFPIGGVQGRLGGVGLVLEAMCHWSQAFQSLKAVTNSSLISAFYLYASRDEPSGSPAAVTAAMLPRYDGGRDLGSLEF